jgi:hypothetical protein
MANDSKTISEQGKILYKAIEDHIGTLKKQQWTITNYIALVYGAIFVASKEIKTYKCFLVAATALVAIYGMYVLGKLQYDLGDARGRMSAIENEIYSEEERRWLKIAPDRNPYVRGLEFTIGLMLVVVVGAIIVGIYVMAHE